MVWTVEFDERARRELRRLDPPVQRQILTYLRRRIAGGGDPRRFAKPLRHAMAGLWRYRIGDYRLICRIERERTTVLVLAVGNRRDIYDAD